MITIFNNAIMTFSSFWLLLGIFMGFLVQCTSKETNIPTPDIDKWETATLVWSDDFDGNEVDTTKWRFQTGDHGWGNREWQNYTPFGSGNAVVNDGTLHITAMLEGSGQQAGDYSSARLNSRQSFLYGRFEIRAKMPDYRGPGLWPALWMLGENISEIGWPESGEIDLMEYVSWRPDSVLVTIHSVANNHINGNQIGTGFIPLPTIEEQFHTYGLLWEEQALRFYIDKPENIVLTIPRPENPTQDNWPFSKPHYFLMNIAVGGTLGGVKGVDDSIFPATMMVDYVKVWQL